jgi:glycosyltransferase involved in cell wall biosynthesis
MSEIREEVGRGPGKTDAVKVMKFVRAFFPGGTERQFVNLALALEPSRLAVHFGCLRRSGELLEEIDARGIPVFDYDVRTFRHPRVISAQFRLARDIRRHGIAIVHTYGFSANVFGIPAAKLAGARVVASIRDMGVYLSTTQRHVQRLICRFADHILVNATAIRDWLVEDGYDGSRITVVPNGIDLGRFAQPRIAGSVHRELGLPVDAPLIGVVGRVTRLKGIEDFLSAAAMIAARFPAARFLIVGDGFAVQGRTVVPDEAYMGELTSLAAQLGLQDRVVFTGFRADVERILAELSVSVLPSLSEGLSNALLESMAAGLPVVASRVGGTGEAVEDGENGLLVPPSDPHAIADAVCRLLDGPSLALRLGHAAHRSVAERYSMNRVAESTSRIYEALLEHDSAASTRTSLNPI